MPDSTKKPPKDSADSGPSFEEAFEKLESVVRQMEGDELPLEQLIENYEAGTRWYQLCQKRLDEAQGRIESIRKKANGEVTIEPFEAGGPGEATEPESAAETPLKEKPSLKEDGQLF